MTICAIHQPNFFPWLGYFDKIKNSDYFVFLDEVDYPKSGKSMGSWTNRVKFNISGEGKWFSVPVVREHGPQIINTVKIKQDRDWRTEFLQMLNQNYREAQNFKNTYELLENILSFETNNLSEFNINSIKLLANELGIQTEWIKQSSLQLSSASGTERLVEICKELNADKYLCGGGAAGYQDDRLFSVNNIELYYQNYEPKPYIDKSNYIAGLSVVDYLMHGHQFRLTS